MKYQMIRRTDPQKAFTNAIDVSNSSLGQQFTSHKTIAIELAMVAPETLQKRQQKVPLFGDKLIYPGWGSSCYQGDVVLER